MIPRKMRPRSNSVISAISNWEVEKKIMGGGGGGGGGLSQCLQKLKIPFQGEPAITLKT